uniref:Uncharacterized LOC108237736 n=1 Tax=Kryptolebias marmoratus TaxID=37003 RepID=A0A3Q3ALF9_KRYMA
MDVRKHVLSAGKAVLDMVEREWQPLSAGELEHRLDQALEEILEADLLAQYISELLQSSKSRTRLAGRACLSLSHTVLLSLSLLSERISYRSVSHRFQLEKGNIHRIFSSFCQRVNALAEEELFPFSSLLEKAEQEEGVPRVLGVLGHTQIPIRLPGGKLAPENEAPVEKRMKKDAR